MLTGRYELKCLQNSQEGEAARLLADWFRERATLAGALMGLPDNMLDVPWREGKFSIREHMVHTIYWERDLVASIVRMIDEYRAGTS